MPLIIQKYGGTSVGSIERIMAVAKKIILAKSQGNDIVVVVSAMSGETNRLVSLAKEISDPPAGREFDVLLSTGEQVTISLLTMALEAQGCPARSYTGGQIPILTDNTHNKARILEIDEKKVNNDLAQGKVVVVAGFQG
ncbi:MAG: aspartate kinase, partial [Candidatus Marithrix sp.]|nr:aspartate kinase [Candidatus Marithrix sp.]